MKKSRQIHPLNAGFLKKVDSENFIGLIGGESTTDTIVIKYLSVSPSFRGENITFQMLEDFSKDGR